MKSNNNPLLIALGAVALVLVLVLVWSISGTSDQSEQASTSQSTEVEKKPNQIANFNKPKRDKAKLSYTEEEQDIGVKKLRLKNAAGRLILPFRVTSKRRCTLGDMDIIKKDLENSSNPRLLLTLESLIPGDQSFTPIVKEVSAAELSSGYRITLSLPESANAQHLGLFICSDADEKNHCFQTEKEVEELNRVYGDYLLLQQEQEKKKTLKQKVDAEALEALDRIYFFNYLLLEDGIITVLDNTMATEGYQKLKTRLSSSVSLFQAGEIAKKVQGLNETLRSVSVEIKNRKMLLNLPQSDRRQCGAYKKIQEQLKQLKLKQ